MKDINYPKMYTCMPKLKQEKTVIERKQAASQDEIECWVPVSCWILSRREHYCLDGSSFIDYETVYTKDPCTLMTRDFPDEQSDDIIAIKQENEVSADYEAIKFLCVNRNQELLKTKFVLDEEEWKRIKSEFLEKEIKYFADSFDHEVKAKVKNK